MRNEESSSQDYSEIASDTVDDTFQMLHFYVLLSNCTYNMKDKACVSFCQALQCFQAVLLLPENSDGSIPYQHLLNTDNKNVFLCLITVQPMNSRLEWNWKKNLFGSCLDETWSRGACRF